MAKNPSKRLGSNSETGPDQIKSQLFFKNIDWDKLARKEVKPPYRPKNVSPSLTHTHTYIHNLLLYLYHSQKGKKSHENFDSEFTKGPCRLSPVDANVIAAIDPRAFEGFSFTNPELYVHN